MLFSGTPIAHGITYGPAQVWQQAGEIFKQEMIDEASVQEEEIRLEHAVRRAISELEEIALKVEISVGKTAADIFRVHESMLQDKGFLNAIRINIRENLLSAESAVMVETNKLAEHFASSSNEYFAARGADVSETGRRLLIHLRKEKNQISPVLTHPVVLIVENLAAADVIGLDRSMLLGLVMMSSGRMSHAALLAATLGIPVVGGVPQLSQHINDGETVIIDGNHGHVIINPSELMLREYSIRKEIFQRFKGELEGLKELPAETLDGRRIKISANVGLAEEVSNALEQGAEGIGLFRTEYFLLTQRELSEEENQYIFYSGIIKSIYPHRVTFRTFDLGADKLTGTPISFEPNPMLGCRGIRVLLENRGSFISQMRALLRASVHGPIRIMFPLITSLTEFQETMNIVKEIKKDLVYKKIPFDSSVPFGCMIETPAAAAISDILATEVEFFSIGSNDLIQYTLAVDRTNPRVANIYEPLHLAILRMMRRIILAGKRFNRSISLCGEMASDPIYTIILLGLGVDELSVNPEMIPAIKKIIRGITYEEARLIALGALKEKRAKDVQAYLERTMVSRFPQVMSVYGSSKPEEEK